MENSNQPGLEENCTLEKNGEIAGTPSASSAAEGSNLTGKAKLWSWLTGSLKIKMTDGRVLIGNFFCTDRDSNVILGSSGEYLKEEDVGVEQPRVLGLVMVPGRHIVSIHYLEHSTC